MQPATGQSLNRYRAAAWVLWVGLYVVMTVIALRQGKRTLVPCYQCASRAWFTSNDIYAGDTGIGFLYLPSACLVSAPIAYLPGPLAEIAWRLFTIGVFAAGVGRLAALAGRDSGRELFLAVTLFAIPLCWSSARNGQMTLPLAGFLMLGLVDAVDARWWRSTLWLALALACKPHAVVLVLLAGALYRPLRWRLAIGVAAVLLAPFGFQHPVYVVDQYAKFSSMLRGSIEITAYIPHAHLFGMLETAGLRVPQNLQTGVRLAMAALTLVACHVARRRCSAPQAGVLIFTYAMCYLLLFNPRTENNTYSALSPALGIFFAQSLLVRRNWLAVVWLLAISVAIMGTYEIGRLFTSPTWSIWLAPLACTCFACWLAVRLAGNILIRQRSTTTAKEATAVAVQFQPDA